MNKECPHCEGSGVIIYGRAHGEVGERDCGVCNGKGEVHENTPDDYDEFDAQQDREDDYAEYCRERDEER